MHNYKELALIFNNAVFLQIKTYLISQAWQKRCLNAGYEYYGLGTHWAYYTDFSNNGLFWW